MEEIEINKAERKRSLVFSRFRRKVLSKHLWAVRTVIMLGIVGVVVLVGFVFIKLLMRTTAGEYLHLAKIFLTRPEGVVKQIDGRTNILLLGKAGEGHTAPDLTDTMILVSIGMGDDPKIIMTSLPRDTWIRDLRTKLNSVYYWGNKKQEGGGLILAKSSVEEITGVPISYAAVIDFSGFEIFIDELGGIDVNVSHSFTDENFPIYGKENDECGGDPEYRCRYETIHFEQGIVHMDGETALKFVRSRQSEDEEEGTDFARAARQRLVIDAVVQRLQDKEIWSSFKKVKKLTELTLIMVETDITNEVAAYLARVGYEGRDNIESYSFDEDLLINPPLMYEYDNLYVFVPKLSGVSKEEDWSEVHQWFRERLP